MQFSDIIIPYLIKSHYFCFITQKTDPTWKQKSGLSKTHITDMR